MNLFKTQNQLSVLHFIWLTYGNGVTRAQLSYTYRLWWWGIRTIALFKVFLQESEWIEERSTGRGCAGIAWCLTSPEYFRGRKSGKVRVSLGIISDQELNTQFLGSELLGDNYWDPQRQFEENLKFSSSCIKTWKREIRINMGTTDFMAFILVHSKTMISPYDILIKLLMKWLCVFLYYLSKVVYFNTFGAS